MRRLLVLLLSSATTLHAADGPKAALEAGQALMKQGDFENAVLKLDEAVRRFATDPTRTRELADAYLLLGISYVELNQEQNAKAKFREVLKKEPQRALSATEYSQQVIRVFEVARQELYPKKKNRFLPILLIAGGGTAAAAGVAVAASGDDPPATAPATTTTTTPTGGGGGGSTTTTTTTVPPGPGNPTPTPTTTLPGGTPTPTPTGPTATPTPTPTGPTATPTPTPTGPTATPAPTATPTQAPTPTPTPACTYTLSPPTAQFGLLGTTLSGPATCSITTQAGCAWTAQKDATWITFASGSSGSGSGAVQYDVAALSLGVRTGRITIAQAPSQECVVVQGTLSPDSTTGAGWESTLDVEGARGQVVVDGQSVRYQERGRVEARIAERPGLRQVVALLVSAKGRPGTWSFRLGAAVPGSLRPLAGDAVQVTPDQITFRLAGQPGERIVFTFEAR